MNDPRFNAERLDELLADRALFALTTDELDELDRLLAASSVDPECFERTAAMAAIGFHTGSFDPLPDGLKSKILKAAFDYVSPEFMAESRLEMAKHSSNGVASRRSPVEGIERRRAMLPREKIAWTMAILLLVTVWFSWPLRILESQARLSAAKAREALLQQERDLVTAKWIATDDPGASGAGGDVIWSDHRQQGFLRFRGLAKNVPDHSQYQLWIFDPKQDERYPISGGVFDIETSDGDIIIPIDAKLRVVNPTMFSVTMERPGGVVVSNRSRLLLIAKPDARSGCVRPI